MWFTTRMVIKDEHAKVLRFLFSGGLAATIEGGSFYLLHGLKLPIILANTISFMCAITVNFFMNKLWVFPNNGNISRQVVLYFSLAGVNLLMSNIIIWLIINEAHVSSLIAKVITMLTIALWNYLFFSKLIFKDRHIDA